MGETSRRLCLLHNALWILCVGLLPQPFCDAKEAEGIEGAIETFYENPLSDKEGYTVNFNNVPIIEYIRFISKITGLNFVFDEADLQFNITLISEEPISSQSIMSALMQILRIHNLTLLEQENNILLTQSKVVNQIPTLVSEDISQKDVKYGPLVTRVFRIKNGNVNSIATILRPLMSSSALVEISNETRQLVVTDITTNVDKIASLLDSLDSPHSPLEIDSYMSKKVSTAELVSLTTQIMTPFTEGNPLLFVPQSETNTIFIVSTPHLIERTLSVLEDLDVSPKSAGLGVSKENAFVYKIINRPASELLDSLTQVSQELGLSASPPKTLMDTLATVRWIKDSNSLIFVGEADDLIKLKEILTNLDIIPSLRSDFLIYNPQTRGGDELVSHLEEIASNLKDAGLADAPFLDAISSMRWVEASNSLIFTGDQKALSRIQEIAKTFDSPGGAISKDRSQSFFLYKLQNAQGSAVLDSLQKMAENLSASTENKILIKTIENIKWVKDTNSLLIVGPPAIVEQAKNLIVQFDVPGLGLKAAPNYFIYKPVKLSAKDLEKNLKELAIDLEEAGLSDADLLQTINTMRYVDTNQTLIFTGTPDSIEKLKGLLTRLDHLPGEMPGIQQLSTVTFLIYKLQFTPATQFMNSLKAFAADLPTTDPADRDFVKSINTMKWIKETNSVLFTGPDVVLKKIEDLAKKFDSEALAPGGVVSPQEYIIYSPKNQKGEELISILCDFERSLMQSGLQDSELFDAINNLKWIEKTSSLIITGTQSATAKVQTLLERFDVPSKDTKVSNIESIENTSFLVYKLQYHQGSDIQEALKQIGQDILAANPSANQNLVSAINTIQWIKITNSLLVSGQQEMLSKLKDLIENLDLPLRQVFIEILIIETSLTNSQSFGLQWGGKMQYFNKAVGGGINNPAANPLNTTTTPANTDLGSALQPINPIGSPAVFPTTVGSGTNAFPPLANPGFDFGVLGDLIMHKGRSFLSLGSLVKALQTDNDSTVVLNPKIIAQDNNTSTIFVGQNIPFAGSSVVQQSQTLTQTSNIEYRDIGVNLSLTPVLGDNDVITLDISVDLTAQVNNTTGNTGQIQGVQTSHTSMNTRVHVPSDHFLALSGMINDTKTRFKSGIPCLGGLPVIGLAFSESDRTNSKDNIIFFVRPHIIDSAEDYKKFTQYQESVYKEQAVFPILKEEFDSAVDIVKTPEDE